MTEGAAGEAIGDVATGGVELGGGGGGGADEAATLGRAVLNPASSLPVQVYPTVFPLAPRTAMLSYMLYESPSAVPDAIKVCPLMGIVTISIPLPLPSG